MVLTIYKTDPHGPVMERSGKTTLVNTRKVYRWRKSSDGGAAVGQYAAPSLQVICEYRLVSTRVGWLYGSSVGILGSRGSEIFSMLNNQRNIILNREHHHKPTGYQQ